MNLCSGVIFNISMLTFLFSMMAVFGILVSIKGMPERMPRSRSRNHPVIGVFLIEYWIWLIVAPIEKVAMMLRMSATAVTFVALLFGIASGVTIGMGYFTAGGWLYLASATLDILDGRIAKRTNTVSRVGGFLDSVLDRYGEMATLIGLGYYFFSASNGLGITLAAMTALGAVMVSYTKSRAEALGAKSGGGFMQRPERAFFVGITTAADCFVTCFIERGVAHPFHWAVIAVLTFVGVSANLTAIQRIVIFVKEIRGIDRKEKAGKEKD
ncbi:MAG: CDP-alcohol phosphatidyltransferase family protein [Pseudomonadota bacterium]